MAGERARDATARRNDGTLSENRKALVLRPNRRLRHQNGGRADDDGLVVLAEGKRILLGQQWREKYCADDGNSAKAAAGAAKESAPQAS